MSALVHIVLANYPAAVEDMDAMGLLKPSVDRKALADDLEYELSKMMGLEPKVRLLSGSNCIKKAHPFHKLVCLFNLLSFLST